jgi:hypothetical protein
MAGISGTLLGARGEIAVDIRASTFEKRRSALYHLFMRGGRVRDTHLNVVLAKQAV